MGMGKGKRMPGGGGCGRRGVAVAVEAAFRVTMSCLPGLGHGGLGDEALGRGWKGKGRERYGDVGYPRLVRGAEGVGAEAEAGA